MADQLPPIEPRPHRGGRLPDLPARVTRASGGLPPITGGDEREAPTRGLPPGGGPNPASLRPAPAPGPPRAGSVSRP